MSRRVDPNIAAAQDSSSRLGDYLTPLPYSFRVIRSVYATKTASAWICLPRKLHAAPPVESDGETEAEVTKPDSRHDSVQALALSDATCEQLRAQLVIVKMNDPTSVLRNECKALDILHYRTESEDFIASWIFSEAYFPEVSASHLCLRPVFGKTLDAFGQACLASTGVPSYFAWHIVTSLLDALFFVHRAGIAHGNLSGANVMLRCQAPKNIPQFRDYPDIVLTDFGAATEDEDGKADDAEGFVKALHYSGVLQSSKAAVQEHSADMTTQRFDPLLRFACSLNKILNTGCAVTLDDLKKKWQQTAVAERYKGPEYCANWIKHMAYDGLVTDAMLEAAARPPLKLKLGISSHKFREWTREVRTPVALKKRTTKSDVPDLLVIKFMDPYIRDELNTLIQST